MADLLLFYSPMTCALVPHVMLSEAGADFRVQALDSRHGGTKTPEFLRINPKHKVPVLVIDGEPLTENIAIQIWIARRYPDANLLPLGGPAEFKALSLMAWIGSGIHPHLVPLARPQQFCDLPGSAEAVSRSATKMLLEDFGIAEQMLNGRSWFFDHFTAIDAYFFWAFRRARSFGVDLSALDMCNRHFERVGARASVQKLLAYDEQLMRDFGRSV